MMQEEIIKTALLGTANVPFHASGDLKDLAERVALHQEDREDGFLKYRVVYRSEWIYGNLGGVFWNIRCGDGFHSGCRY